jgi:hypothetical protein
MQIRETVATIIFSARGAPPFGSLVGISGASLRSAPRSGFAGLPSGGSSFDKLRTTLSNVEGSHGPQALHKIKVFVVPLDPVERRRRVFVDAGIVSDITHAQPEGDLGVTPHDAADGIEVGVDIA